MGDSGHREVRSGASAATSDGFARRTRKGAVTAIFRIFAECVGWAIDRLPLLPGPSKSAWRLAEGTVTGKRVARAFNKAPRLIERYCGWFESLKLFARLILPRTKSDEILGE